MSYTVGLDFGTHQTKVCIEDASNPAQKIYEFVEFTDLNGNNTVLLPSIIQLNEDDTLSYGFTDESRCKMASLNSPEPELKLPKEPIRELPEKPALNVIPPRPKKPALKGHSLRDQITLQKNYERQLTNWEKACAEGELSNNQLLLEWEDECQALENDYAYDCVEYAAACAKARKEFVQAYRTWQHNNQPQKQIFRYFKLATFTSQERAHTIKPEQLSTWYLTFVLFKVREKIGIDFYTQMGVPFSISKFESATQKKIALRILVAANKLMDYYEVSENFLKATVVELNTITSISTFEEKEIIEYGLNVLPEAFAGLTSVTQQGKLSRGMHLLADIGGGTTDIAFFTITSQKLPDVHAVLSIPKGLNYIFEEYMKSNNESSIEKIQMEFSNSQLGFESSITSYHSELTKKSSKLIQRIEQEFCDRKSFHGLPLSRLRTALEKRPLVFCGGGALYDSMRVPLHTFTDVMLINKELLNIPNVKNTTIKNQIFPMLATSYGLSIQLENEIAMTRIEEVFVHLNKDEEDQGDSWHNEHGLRDD